MSQQYRVHLIQLRNNRGYTRAELANKLGVSEVYISKIERGERRPSIRLMLAFQEFYGVPLQELFADEFQLKEEGK